MQTIHDNPPRSEFDERVVPVRRGALVVPLGVVIAWLTLLPAAQAQCPSSCDSNDNTALGDGALQYNGGGAHRNTAIGREALRFTYNGGGFGNDNTATGYQALSSNLSPVTVTGSENTATGSQALYNNQTGDNNTATGFQGLNSNTNGNDNTANGAFALQHNTSGSFNAATGFNALLNNNANNNTATGAFALQHNTTGANNTATGNGALDNNNASNKTATGVDALQQNTTGTQNTASGFYALKGNTTGSSNTADGVNALISNTIGSNNTANGWQALQNNTTGANNVALGFRAGYNLTTGTGNICIGSGIYGVAGDSNTTRIRNIYGSVATARAVYVDADNKIGTLSSSRRYKEEIRPMDKASETILHLNPVTFRYKKEVDPAHVPMFGLIAEEVDKVDPDLVTRDEKGKAETVRYEAVNAMLLNEFLKEHRKVGELELKLAEQQKDFQTASAQQKQEFESKIALQQKQIEALIAGLHKVNAQLEASKFATGRIRGGGPSLQVAVNNQ